MLGQRMKRLPHTNAKTAAPEASTFLATRGAVWEGKVTTMAISVDVHVIGMLPTQAKTSRPPYKAQKKAAKQRKTVVLAKRMVTRKKRKNVLEIRR